MLDWNDIRYFVAVAEEGHVTRAAERLGMGQPPLESHHVRIERRDAHMLQALAEPQGDLFSTSLQALAVCGGRLRARADLAGAVLDDEAISGKRLAARGLRLRGCETAYGGGERGEDARAGAPTAR